MEKSNKKPVKNIFNCLKVLASLPLKTRNTEDILEKWYLCAQWNSKAS